MGFKPFGKGKGGEARTHKDGKPPFEPTLVEQELIRRFGGKDRLPFADVQKEIAEAEVVEERRGPLWDAIRESRTDYDARQSRGVERGR